MSVCPACNTYVKKGEKFCRGCGRPLSEELRKAAAASADGPAPSTPPGDGGTARLCPLCRALYSPPARYCGEDGSALEEVKRYVLPPLTPSEPEITSVPSPDERPSSKARYHITGGRGSRRLRTGLVVALILLVLGGFSAYFFPGGYRGGTAKMESQLREALKTRGVSLEVKVDKDAVVSVTGKVETRADREAALAIIRSHGGVKRVVENIRIAPSPLESERALNEELDGAGLSGVLAQVDGRYRVTMTGTFHNQGEKAMALSIVRRHLEVKEVLDRTHIGQRSPSPTEGARAASFTEAKHFSLSPLTPSSWTSLKYKDSLTFRVPGPGRITVEATWESGGMLALMLNSASTGAAHGAKDGPSPLRLTYRITPKDFADSPSWEATIANFTANGHIQGGLKISFSTGGQKKSEVFDAAKVEKEMNKALEEAGIKGVTAEVTADSVATLKGSVQTLEVKEKALVTVKRFKAIKSVKDIIFVVGR